jgi:uncharacterized repeat protein (TIGR01451 family)
MDPNTNVTGSADLQFDPSLPAGTALSGTATVSSPTADPVAANDSASGTATITVSADLHVTKTLDTPLVAGADATYTISVTNKGPSDASGVSMTDPLPFPGSAATDLSPSQGSCTLVTDTASCDLGGLVPGATATVAVIVHVPPDATGSATNTATATSVTPDPNTADNSATTTDPIGSAADVQIVKAASVSSIAAGGVVDYTLTVTNAGPSSAANVTVTDAIVSGFTVVVANTSLIHRRVERRCCTHPRRLREYRDGHNDNHRSRYSEQHVHRDRHRRAHRRPVDGEERGHEPARGGHDLHVHLEREQCRPV